MPTGLKIKIDQAIKGYDMGGWLIDEDGVSRQHLVKKGDKVVEAYPEYASPIPLVPISILENIDCGVEKVELLFYKQGAWKKIISDRSTTANRSTIIKLADKGVEVNSDNAGLLVKYIADIISKNMLVIPRKPAKSTMGWTESGEFMPYSENIYFDGDDQYKFLYKAIAHKGTLTEWVDYVKPLRKYSMDLRLAMAASFASPLIELIGENSFVFHLWGGTGTAKTVSLMVAMSVFGNPAMGAMTRTMNMTANAMLSTASFLKNLPFAGDELQTIKNRWGNYDSLIMCITEGIDRGRMSYDKINEVRSWKCSFLFTGEEPCTKQSSGGGVKSRVIEMECRNKIVENGMQTANFVRSHYGCAGNPYIEYVKQQDIKGKYSDHFGSIMNDTDTTDKQAGAMAIMLTADEIARELFFPEERPLVLDDILSYMYTSAEVDVTERAYQYMMNCIAENQNNFSQDSKQVWGVKTREGIFFNKNVLSRLLEEQGYDFEACKAKWLDKGYIEKTPSGRFVHYKSVYGIQALYVKFSVCLNENDKDPELPW